MNRRGCAFHGGRIGLRSIRGVRLLPDSRSRSVIDGSERLRGAPSGTVASVLRYVSLSAASFAVRRLGLSMIHRKTSRKPWVRTV
jgi:hypothetical protein